MYFFSCFFRQWLIQDFSDGDKKEGALTYNLTIFFKKLLKNEKKSDKRGAPPVPLRPSPNPSMGGKRCVHSKVSNLLKEFKAIDIHST